MVPTDGWTLGAAGVVGVAVLQVVLGRWRDLGPATLTAGGILVVLALPAPSVAVWAGVAVAALVASIGWARGARRGVGHPSVDGAMLGIVIAVSAASTVLSAWPPVGATAATAIGVVGAVALALSLRSPGARHRPVRWVGEITVTEPVSPVRGST